MSETNISAGASSSDEHVAATAEFKPGDRVKLSGVLTNFGGYTGTITRWGSGPRTGDYCVWMVKLDDSRIETAEYQKALSRV